MLAVQRLDDKKQECCRGSVVGGMTEGGGLHTSDVASCEAEAQSFSKEAIGIAIVGYCNLTNGALP